MTKFVRCAKYVLFTLLTIVALVIAWALGCATIPFTTRSLGIWGAIGVGGLVIGLSLLGILSLLYLLSKKLPFLRRKYPFILFALAIYMAAAIAIFAFPIKVPPVAAADVPHELITLSKGEQIALYHFQPEKKISDTPILFVPGGPGGPVKDSAMAFMKQLAAQGFDVYAFDHYSGGNSSLNTFNPSLLTIDDEVRRVHEIMSRIGTPQLYVIGHSYAGALLGRVDAQYPEQIAKLVLLDTSPLYDLSNGNLKSAATLDPELAKMLKDYESGTNTETGDSQNGVFQFLPNFSLRENIRATLMLFIKNKYGVPAFGKNDEVSFYIEEFVKIAQGQIITADTPRTFVGLSLAAQAINDSITQSPDYSQALIDAKTSPVLVVHPENGIVPWPIHKDYENFFDSVVFFPLANADHGVWAKPENATIIVNVIRDFLLDRADPALFYTGYTDPFTK